MSATTKDKPPRLAECPLCHRRVAVREDGALAPHAHTPMVGERCPGSGKLVLK